MNPELPAMLEMCLSRGFRVLVLTNAMRPMMKMAGALLAAKDLGGERLIIRVSVDHYTRDMHEYERGDRSWAPMLAGLRWLVAGGFNVHVAARSFTRQTEAELRRRLARLFADHAIPIDATRPPPLPVLSGMDPTAGGSPIT